MKRRIGLFGGTFNPIHIGHLRSVIEVREAFGLDKVYLILSAVPPHKSSIGLIDAKDRLNMIRLAVEQPNEYSEYSKNYNDKPFEISDVEIKRAGRSYTIDTVRYFKSIAQKNDSFYLIVGLDAFLEIHSWKSYEALLESISIIVMARPEENPADNRMRWEILKDYLNTEISKDYSLDPVQSAFVHPNRKKIHTVDVSLLDISSAKIRKMIGNNRSIRYLVPDKVEAFINTRGLFR